MKVSNSTHDGHCDHCQEFGGLIRLESPSFGYQGEIQTSLCEKCGHKLIMDMADAISKI